MTIGRANSQTTIKRHGKLGSHRAHVPIKKKIAYSQGGGLFM